MAKHLHPVGRGYGWKRPLPDPHKPQFVVHFAGPLPTEVDLRSGCPAIYDQADLGSCTANSLAGLAEFLMMKQGFKPFVPSRLFIYYNERVIEDSVQYDAGATLTDGATVLSKHGCPHESMWWYNTAKFAVKPNHGVYADGALHCVNGMAKVAQNLDSMKSVLAAGLPFVVGFNVYESFESDAVANTGIVPMPKTTEELLGGHAVLVVGYDDSKKWFIVRNSWGTGWGDKGYFYMPYAFLTNSELADDFWAGTHIN